MSLGLSPNEEIEAQAAIVYCGPPPGGRAPCLTQRIRRRPSPAAVCSSSRTICTAPWPSNASSNSRASPRTTSPPIEAALCALGRVPYDTIVTDLLLGGGESGQELERRLRQTRLILLSGHIRALEKASGFDLVLRKPCDPDVLLQKLLGPQVPR